MAAMNYVVAVSGGVDSMVILDMLVQNDRRLEIGDWRFLRSPVPTNHDQRITNHELIVAHFDHGIRNDSSSDEAFVRGVAGEYGLAYESERAELGPDASEETAREARYKFLRRCCNKYNAVLITAHHQDDVVETMLINLIRGTHWRGLAPMANLNSKSEIRNPKQIRNPKDQNSDIKHQTSNIEHRTLRPLLNTPKADILKYAKKHNLTWREDSTNADTKYLRNYIRLELLPKMLKKDPQAKQKLLAINQNLITLKKQIATESQSRFPVLSPQSSVPSLPRYDLTMLPHSVAQDLIYQILTTLDPAWHPNSQQLKRVLHFAKTAWPGKTLEVGKRLRVESKKTSLQFKNT